MASSDAVARYRRVQALFLDALEVAPSERDAFLEASGADDALRHEVRELLAAHTGTGPLDDALLPDRPAAAPGGPDPMLGRSVGPWRLQERLGAGGMGTVYRAIRDDGLYEREVAVKLLRPGADAQALGRRLRAERQILARLEHPHIARLYDGGVTRDEGTGEGLPYLVLELVKGEELTQYAERRALSVEARLRLLLDVCDAVAYAHRNLVVHRDLKPSNILVTDDETERPQVKLLDFGIARLLADDESEALTRTAGRLLTPAYAAPEQLTGDAITTATDVYALGIVLYELLVGRRPYDLRGKTAGEMERIVCATEPAKPSTALLAPPPDEAAPPAEHSDRETAELERRARRLRGDLDTIVLKALAKEPERRYASAEALGEDLRRHLQGVPVAARPATRGYRLRKFVRRHRTGVAAVALIALTLVGGLTAALWQASIAAAERDRTAAALTQAEGTLDFLENTILMGDPQQGDPDAPLSAVLDSAAARVDSEADPAVAGAIHASLANVYLGRGLPERAEHHARRALDALPTDDHARRGNALTSLAQALADAGRSADAEPYHEQSIALLREAGDERGLAVALNTYGVTLFNLGRTDEAEATYEQSLAILRRLDESAASTLNNLAILFTEQGRAEEATEVFDEMVADLRQQRTPGAAYSLGFALANRASALSNLNRADEALAGYREANAQFEDVLGPEHPETITSRVTLAFHLHRMGRFDDARREGAAALAMADSLLGDGHPYTAYAQTIAGAAYCDAGEPDRGAPLLRASLATRRTMVPADHWILANGESLLGGCLARLGRNEEASDLLQRSYDALRAALGPEHAKTQEARDRLRHHVGDGAVL